MLIHKTTLLDHERVEIQLGLGSFDDPLIHRVLFVVVVVEMRGQKRERERERERSRERERWKE